MRLFLIVFGVIIYAEATQVKQCPNTGKPIDDISQRVQIGACNKPPCRLRKDTNVNVTIKFKPNQELKQVKTAVNANILGIAFPFVGVDGEPACNNIYKADGKTKAGCDLKAGEEYIFKSSIEVLKLYPRLKTVVHWGLLDAEGKDVICFEVPARITN